MADFRGSWQDAILQMADAALKPNAAYSYAGSIAPTAVDAANAQTVSMGVVTSSVVLMNDSEGTIHASFDGISYLPVYAGESVAVDLAITSLKLYAAGTYALRVLAPYHVEAS